MAGLGFVVNTVSALLFLRDKDRDLNGRGMYLHLMADALTSVGVVVAGIVISYTNWFWLYPIIGLIVDVVNLVSTWQLLTESLRLSLDGVLTGIVWPPYKPTCGA